MTEARRQARGNHRHRRHGRAVRAPPGQGVRELYVFQRTPSSLSTCAATTRPTWSGSNARCSSPAGSRSGSRTSPRTRAWAFRIPKEDLVQDGWTDLARRIRFRIRKLPFYKMTPKQHARGVRGLRLREDGGDPRPGGRGRRGSGDGREPQGLVPPALQAAVLPRRVPSGLQRARHDPRRHRRQGRRADHEEGDRRERRGVRARLHHLRVGLRGRHRP